MADEEPKPLTPIQIQDQFYDILAGAGKSALLLAAIDLGIERLLAEGPLSESKLIERLELEPFRGYKWLIMLETAGLIIGERKDDESEAVYSNGSLFHAIATPEYEYFYREFLRYWRTAAAFEMVPTIRGGEVKEPVRYPPEADADVALLHEWMSEGVKITLDTIERSFDFKKVRHVLDVGGGDASMACELIKRHKNIDVTVFNVPKAAALGRKRIEKLDFEDQVRVNVFEGNFFEDFLPTGFDLVMFSRVLADWPPLTCKMLLEKAHRSLLKDGWLLVCEPFRDQNPALAVAWEHSYLPYDDFGAYVYKTVPFYQKMMEKAGFSEVESHPRPDDSIHGVVTARKRVK